MSKILVVEDDSSIRELLQYNLEREGFEVKTAPDGIKGLEEIETKWPDLIILDLMLPGRDGLEIVRIMKSNSQLSAIPVIMLTAKSEEIDRILGLEMGADDYVTKPFSTREVVARIRALLRRIRTVEKDLDKKIVRGSLIIDSDTYEAHLGERKLELTPKEFQLLHLLASRPGKVFTRDFLLEHVWGYDYIGDSRTVDVHIRHLRQKLEDDVIETVRGVGYKFKDI
ncbi:MAG: two-component system, OmpR family, alkaline phosphatase synthesis response regulator PhoP [Clostridia bacterium]|jgi:two-component system alkaline phosphatase synthesis response regulator PhoP|nr:two-component system, OmpR family, alkaline phosphatase synthesis response regulator PhoP [Clostridia bacterium]